MPISVGYFRIRGPRISRINSASTMPPDSLGTFSTSGAFYLDYSGSGSGCVLNVTGGKIITLIDEERNHPDNLDIPLGGRNLGEIVEDILENPSYSLSLDSTSTENLFFPIEVVRQDIKNNPILIEYNTEKEYLVDVEDEGDLGVSSINTKTEDFSYSGQLSRWMIDEGNLYDSMDIPVLTDGTAKVGDEGVYIKFFKTLIDDNNDLTRTISFDEVELARSLDTEVSSITFQAAPILLDDTLQVFINSQLATENQDYVISYGTSAEIIASKKEPYSINSSNNIFKVRVNNYSAQTFILPIGNILASEIVEIINSSASGFSSDIVIDDTTGQVGFKIMHDRGTAYHQLRIEDGNANFTLGFENYQSKIGEGTGEIRFTKYIQNEDLSLEEGVITDTLRLDAINKAGNNPFLGVATISVDLFENDIPKIKNIDFFVDSSGTIQLSYKIDSEKLVGAILKLDNDLFPPDYIIYDNDIPLIEGEDYIVNPQGGWITLEESAFPGHVFKADYTNKNIGKIEGEIILGEPAFLEGSKKGPFVFSLDNNTLKVSVNNSNEQTFTFDPNPSVDVNQVVDKINSTSIDLIAYSKNNSLVLVSKVSGPSVSLSITGGTSLNTLGFELNQSKSGKGAEGGERGLEVRNAPMDRTGFTAPEGGDTIIIKNKDVTSRYKKDTVIKIVNDYYQISSSVLENDANLISSTPGPYTFLSETNDDFNYIIDDQEYTVKFEEGSGINTAQVVSQINSVSPGVANLINFNGQEKIQLKGSLSVEIKQGLANRTIGFDEGDLDTNNPDTVIKISGFFKSTYIAPDMFTSIDPVEFLLENSEKLEVPQNSNSIKILGNHLLKYRPNCLIRIGSIHYHQIASSFFSDGVTEILLKSKTTVPIFKDTTIQYSFLPIFTEGDNTLISKYYPLLDQNFKLIKNNTTLIINKEYQIDESGVIILNTGLKNGDDLVLEYFGRRFIDSLVNVKSNYGYFNFLRKGSNIKISLLADNSDNFYINVLHGTTLLAKVVDDLARRTQNSVNSSSGGFPTGAIPPQPNDGQGSDSHYFRIKDIQHKIEASLITWRFYDDRIYYFETERQSINGYIVGAENGRLTESQLIYVGENPRPNRLFPLPDNRPFEERPEPLKLPCLFGENKNDAGSSTNGNTNFNLLFELNSEKNRYLAEKNKLNTLKTFSTTSAQLNSTGGLFLLGGEQIQLYVEIQGTSGSFKQAYVTVTFGPGTTIPSPPLSPPSSSPSYNPPTTGDIASDINNAVNAAMGEVVNPCSSHSGFVRLNASSSSKTKCCYVVQDHPQIGFGVGNQASIRSRHTLYTGGYVYNTTVAGTTSVTLDIQGHNIDRDDQNTLLDTQINMLKGQMYEWLAPFQNSFDLAKLEKERAFDWKSRNEITTDESNDFNNIKTGSELYNSIDNIAVIDSRIIDIDFRISEIDQKISLLNSRLTEISNTLNSESLYSPRYSWLNLLVNEENGYYAEEKREILEEEKRKKQAENNIEALKGLGSLT
jgi:hypothetical protein